MSGTLSRGSSDVQLEGRGRVRRCKHCKFSCTDAKEFFHHQMMEHGEVNDQVYSTPNKGLPKLTQIRKRNSISSQEEVQETVADEISEKTNGDTIIINNIQDDDDDDGEDDGRLIIADETEDGSNSESTITPTRSGNIQNRTYVCGVCDFSSTSAKLYLTHQKDEHKFDIIIYECDICDYATKYKQKLPRHRKLHFSGQDFLVGEGMPGEMDEYSGNGYSNDDPLDHLREDDDMPQDTYKDLPPLIDSNTVIVHPTDPDDSINLPSTNNTPTEKKTKKRQEVDPAKYFEVVDDTGCKYACSSCGNVYKWRKSLNKHWKEKHGGEMPDNSRKPPGLMYLVNSGGHTICGRRKILANSVLNKSQNGSLCDTSTNSSAPGTPMSSSVAAAAAELMMSMPEFTRAIASPITTAIPSFIGPFVTNSLQPVFPETSTPNMNRSKQILKPKDGQLGNKIRIQGQNEPLDFSVKKDDEAVMQSSYLNIKSEPDWDHKEDGGSKDDKEKQVLQCNKCSFVGKTVVDYSAHMSLHLSRRAFKCAECQEHFNGVDDLNSHFAEVHANRIQEHKEAIQRIPHGLQQTYHLLKMPLNAITSLNSQDLASTTNTSTDSNKKLKCNMCSFVAKWPAELQKHAVSHSEERPFMCMVCGSTYKWKWDLVKHFEKSHHTLPNPYKRREMNMGKNGSSPSMAPKNNMSLDEESLMYKQSNEDPPNKRRRLSDSGVMEGYDGMDEDESRNSLSHLSNLNIDVNGLASIGRSMAMSGERPSSLPRFADMDDEEMAEFMQQRENLLASRPINETTQKAVAAAVMNRLNNPPSLKEQQQTIDKNSDDSSILLPYKCQRCEYRARWPSEITQHMKNHSEDKPYLCPRCSYRSKWKWDVVKHLKRCGGGGTIRDVIDTTKTRKTAPPNVMVMPEGRLQQQTPQQFFKYQQMSEAMNNDSALASIAKMTMDKQELEKALKDASRKPVFRSLINEGLYHCLECQFVGTSPAELKRHAVLHSENKPFTCEVCGYSSRWKCDLKKHMRTYRHYTSAAQMIESQNDNANSDAEDSENNFQCNKCYFSTDQQHLLKAHLQIHESTKSGNTGRFKCKQCSFQVNDLASFLQHRVTHTSNSNNSGNSSPAPSQNSPAASQTSESPKTDMDEARLKHPRKPVKTFQCSKCDFVCKSRDLLENHELDHETDEQQYKCVYCEESFKTKDSLLDHITTHSDFNPDEWEVFFMDEEVEENNNEPMESLEYLKKSEGSSSETPRLASALGAGSQYLSKQSADPNNQPKKLPGGIVVPASRKFTCEWCDATFAHVTTLYHHGKNVHPIELNSQEMAESARDFMVTSSQMKNMQLDVKQLSPQYTAALSGANPYLLNPALLTSQVMSQVTSVNKERPILPNNLDPMKFRKSLSPQKKAKSFQCTKCPFTAPNAVTYLRHIERHGSNCKHTCWFCDYSIDRLNLLYQHMKGTHTDQWRKTATTGDVSPKPDSRDYSSSYGSDDNEPTNTGLQIKEELMLKGVPVQICSYNGRRVFKCKKCSYISTNAANTTNHARQHNPTAFNDDKPETVTAMNNLVKALRVQKEKKKAGPIQCNKCPFKALLPEDLNKHSSCHGYNGMYRCEQCDFSTDEVMMLTQHMQLHENNQPLQPKKSSQSFIPITSTFNKLTNKVPIKDKLLHIQARTSLNKSRRIRYRCSRCPYNSFSKDNMVKHRRQHITKSRFRCPICNYSATRDYLLFQHMKFHGGDTEKLIQQFKEKNLKTDAVMNPFEEDESLDSNMRSENENSLEDDMVDGRMNSCKGCPFTCDTEEDLKKHIRLHFTDNQYKCDYCTLTEESLSPLLEHRLLHSNEKDFNDNPAVATLMNKTVSDGVSSTNQDSPQGLKEEMRYNCDVCPYKCNSIKSYNVHQSMHGINKKFICDYCNWSIDRLNLLYQHRRVHNKEPGFDPNPEELVFMNREYALGSTTVNDEDGENEFDLEKLYNGKNSSYSCPDCPFTTANQNSFINHKAFHETSAKHQCTDCSYSVDEWTLMCQHKKLHEASDSSTSPSKKRLKCARCPYHTQNPQLLENHMKAHASDQEKGHKESTNIKSPSSKSPHSSNIQVIEPGTSKIACPQLYFSSNTDEVMSDNSEEEFKCNRCPFSTTTKQLLDEHEHRHNFKNRVSCPYCDFSCMSEPQILEHIQVHFPGTSKEALKLMLERRQKEPNNNSEDDDQMALKVTLKTAKDESEPDSTVSESQKSQQSDDKSEEKNENMDSEDIDKSTTKVYVCQYCEREFDKKSNMITHERQHLIGQK